MSLRNRALASAARSAWRLSAIGVLCSALIGVLGIAACEDGSDDDGGGASGAAGSNALGGSRSEGGNDSGGASFGGSHAGGFGGNNTGGAAGSTGECFSPIESPELALDSNAIGCPCTFGESCVLVDDGGRPHALALVCERGRWQSVEDGPCAPQVPRAAACKVLGRIYSSGSTYVPDPHSCNICSCEDGQLTCTEINCPSACPPNGGPGTQCVECGPTDACLVVEHTCLPVCSDHDSCEGKACLSGMCRSVCG